MIHNYVWLSIITVPQISILKVNLAEFCE